MKSKTNKFSFKKLLSLKLLAVVFILIWLVTVVVFISCLTVGTNFFQTTVDQGFLQNDTQLIILGINVFIGIVAFLIFAILITIMAMKKGKEKQKSSLFRKLIRFILFFIYLAILPIYLLIKIWKPNKLISFFKNLKKNINKRLFFVFTKKILLSLLVSFLLLPIWIGGYSLIGMVTAAQLGFLAEETRISGTGSMYPTFPKGEGEDLVELSKQVVSTQGMFPYPNGLVISGKRHFGHEIQRGDIVIVEDEKTRKITEEMYNDPSGWVKRVIAIAGDTLEIRDGIVYLNEEPQKEPYVAKARSTFGESFLQECQQITVPDNSVFVMGDNRTGSGDSREVGFFSINDIKYALPWKNQEKNLSQNWHDASNDLEESARIELSKENYVTALNQERENEGLKPLKYQEELEQSAQKRGEIMLEYNDFSNEATVSGYTAKKAMGEAGYYNTLWGESFNSGYYEAQELLDNQLEFPESKSFIFDKRFQEVGIAEVLGEINGCPTHIIVQHFGGYVPPNYSTSDVQSWETALESLRSIQSGWNDLKNSGDFYTQNKEKIDRINQVIDLRINKIADIVGTMKANKWFSAEQRAYVDTGDTVLYDEQEGLATFLNEQ